MQVLLGNMKPLKIKYLKNKKDTMKKIVLLLTFTLLFGFSGFSQTVLDKYEGQDNVSAVVVNKKMFELMSKVKMEDSDQDAQKYLALIKNLENLKVFKTSSAKITGDMRLTVEKYLASANLEQLMKVNENGKNAKIYVKSGAGTNVKELLMFIEGAGANGNETVLMSLTGDFNLNDIALLTKRMKLPGGDVLNEASKK